MLKFNNIAVYCGSNYGAIPDYHHSAILLGKILAKRNIGLVYGGGALGLMGVIADSVIENHGKAIGIIPEFLAKKEVAHKNLSEIIVTHDMPSRKSLMIEKSDAFIAMAGGVGTYEELFEVLSLLQLKQNCKPIGLLNVAGFFDPLLAMLNSTAEAGFMPKENLALLCVDEDPELLLQKMENFKYTDANKWVQPNWLNGGSHKTLLSEQ